MYLNYGEDFTLPTALKSGGLIKTRVSGSFFTLNESVSKM